MNAIRFFSLIGIFTLILVCGCGSGDPAGLVRRFIPPADEAIATNYIALLREGRFELIQKDIDPSFKDTFTSDLLSRMAAVIPKQDPLSVKVVSARIFQESDRYEVNFGFEYQFPTNWIVINVATLKKGGMTTLIGFHVYRCSDSLENFNKFRLEGKGPTQYVVLALAIAIPIFIIYSLVTCIRTKLTGRKWLWIIFILVGLGRLGVDWTTGHWSISPFYFLLFGASAFASPYSAWTVSVAVPVGAILFWIRRNELSVTVAPLVEPPAN
jgi:hypothetical protein